MKKRISAFVLLALVLALLAGCSSKEPAAQPGISGTPEEIIAKIYEAHKPIDLSLVGMDVDLTDENAVQYYTGLESGDRLSAVSVSETMLGQPYSLVVARVKDGADAAKVAKEMYDNIDTRKWICVAADTKTAACYADVVMFFMVDSAYSADVTAQSIADAFQTVCGGKVTMIG